MKLLLLPELRFDYALLQLVLGFLVSSIIIPKFADSFAKILGSIATTIEDVVTIVAVVVTKIY